jgi:hypothetical protein
MQEPAPTSAATAEAASTSFNRIRDGSLGWFGAKCPSLDWWEKSAAKNNIRHDHTRRRLPRL